MTSYRPRQFTDQSNQQGAHLRRILHGLGAVTVVLGMVAVAEYVCRGECTITPALLGELALALSTPGEALGIAGRGVALVALTVAIAWLIGTWHHWLDTSPRTHLPRGRPAQRQGV
jgi:hypothetical protein